MAALRLRRNGLGVGSFATGVNLWTHIMYGPAGPTGLHRRSFAPVRHYLAIRGGTCAVGAQLIDL